MTQQHPPTDTMLETGQVPNRLPDDTDTDMERSQTSRSTSDQLKQQGQQATQKAKAKANEFSDKAQDKVDEGMDQAAAGLGQAANKVRQQGENSQGTTATTATKAADMLDSASSYLRANDTGDLMNDLESLVREKPVESMLVAAGAGFVLAKIFR